MYFSFRAVSRRCASYCFARTRSLVVKEITFQKNSCISIHAKIIHKNVRVTCFACISKCFQELVYVSPHKKLAKSRIIKENNFRRARIYINPHKSDSIKMVGFSPFCMYYFGEVSRRYLTITNWRLLLKPPGDAI